MLEPTDVKSVVKAPTENEIVNIENCIFDMDGLLINTEDIYTIISDEILKAYGKKTTMELKAAVSGRREIEATKKFIEICELPITVDEMRAIHIARQNELFPACKPMPGALELVTRLKENNVPIALATSSTRRAFALKSKNNSFLFDNFPLNMRVFGEDVPKSKPEPDIFLHALHKIAPGCTDASRSIVFEDSLLGVQAGLRAGARVVWVRSNEFAAALVNSCAKENILQSSAVGNERASEGTPLGAVAMPEEALCYAVIESLNDFNWAWLGKK